MTKTALSLYVIVLSSGNIMQYLLEKNNVSRYPPSLQLWQATFSAMTVAEEWSSFTLSRWTMAEGMPSGEGMPGGARWRRHARWFHQPWFTLSSTTSAVVSLIPDFSLLFHKKTVEDSAGVHPSYSDIALQTLLVMPQHECAVQLESL